MQKFKYEAKDQATGKIVKATLQTDSEADAGKLLLRQGYTPLKIELETENDNILAKITGRITTKDRIVFTRQLATLVGAGLPLTQSFHTVYEQTPNKQLQAVQQEIIGDIEGGKTLSFALGKHPDLFDTVYISLVAAGEASGTLDTALSRIAAQQEKDAAAMSKIKGAMTYPLIVLFVIAGVMGFMLFSVMPQVQKLYHDLKKPLPPLSQFMVDMTTFVGTYWWLVIIILAILGVVIRQYFLSPSGVSTKDKLKLKMPIIGNMTNKLYMARFARTGQTLLASGVTMLDMLKITSRAINNTLIEKSIQRAADKVKGGKPLSKALEGEENIAQLIPQMIGIGEQSGKIDEMMGKAADVYENELDEQIRNISTLIEPVLMVVLAVFAGLMVASILLPIYSLVSNMNVG